MNLPLFIAFRYLLAKKSHNVINVISAISVIGMAIGTAALIVILSVYNGFDSIVRGSLSELDPDVKVTPQAGKAFVPDSAAFSWVYAHPAVLNMSSVVEENVFVSYDGRQAVAKAKGVDRVFEEETPISGHTEQGVFRLRLGNTPQCAVGSGLAWKLGINPAFVQKVEVYFPSRSGNISLANPAASLRSVRMRPSCTFSVNSSADENLIILPLETLRGLLGYDEEVSAIEIRLLPGATEKGRADFIDGLRERLGDGFKVADRVMQNPSLYKMMAYEKAAVWLILIFVVIIIAFNIFGSLTMLIIEKDGDIATLRSMGAPDGLIRSVFVLEGWMISLLGLAVGLLLGVGFAILQQRFGFVKMPGGFMASAYPVIIQGADVALTAVIVALIGYVIALVPVKANLGGKTSGR